MQARQLGELGLIDRIRRGALDGQSAQQSRVRVGIGDDCAVLRVPRGHELLVTTDLFLEGRHFRRDWHTPESAGHRCLARGLSDLAAMGAQPLAAFLSLAVPGHCDVSWLDAFLQGMFALAEQAGVTLAGGDTSESPGSELLADILLTGTARAGRALLRSGAKPGDRIFVTGALGGSAAELLDMAAGFSSAGGRQSWPEPRLAVGQALLKRGLASAAIDLSDGLSTDLRHLCELSGVGAEIVSARLPVDTAASNRLDLALHGGEDYELLFTAPADKRLPATIAGVNIAEIGRVVATQGIRLDGEELTPGGWQHLSERSRG